MHTIAYVALMLTTVKGLPFGAAFPWTWRGRFLTWRKDAAPRCCGAPAGSERSKNYGRQV